MQSWWMKDVFETHGAPALVSWIVLVVGSIVIHELAHGWVAIKCGDDVPLHTGHMTINPFVHIPPFAWIMFVLVGITWGLMPVNPANFRRKYDDALVSFAGPASNFILGFVFSFLYAIWETKFSNISNQALQENMSYFLQIGTILNLILGCFNLLPVPPLDGFRIVLSFFPGVRRLFGGSDASQIVMVVCMVLLFMFGSKIVMPIGAFLAGILFALWQIVL